MINFRFHIVSLIAVFLALAVGILFGSAFGKPTLIENLNKEINRVERKADAANALSGQLQSEQHQLNDYIQNSASYIVQERLPGTPVLVVAQRGVNDKTVSDTVNMVRAAGAEAPAVVWLEPRWQLTAPGDVTALAHAVNSNAQSPEALRAVALGALAERLRVPDSSGTGTKRAQGSQNDVLRRLSDAGFVTVSGVGKNDFASFPPRAARAALVIDGDQSKFADTAVFNSTIRSLVNAGVPTLAGEVYVASQAPNALQRGDIVGPVRSDATLSKKVSTIDDLDLTQGQVTAVLALEDLVAGNGVGQYGYGKGATRGVPASPIS
jgi:hypothetical protein